MGDQGTTPSALSGITRRVVLRGLAGVVALACVPTPPGGRWPLYPPVRGGAPDRRPRIVVTGIGDVGLQTLELFAEANLRGVELVHASTEHGGGRGPVSCTAFRTRRFLRSSPPLRPSLARVLGALSHEDVVVLLVDNGESRRAMVASRLGELARSMGVLTVAVVGNASSSSGNGSTTDRTANGLVKSVDVVVVNPHETSALSGAPWAQSDHGIRAGQEASLGVVRLLAEFANYRGVCGVDFLDVRYLLLDRGLATVGTGTSYGDARFVEATRAAMASNTFEPRLLAEASALIVMVTSSPDASIGQVFRSVERAHEEFAADPDVVWAWNVDEMMDDRVDVTLLAAGPTPQRPSIHDGTGARTSLFG
jgi:cell division protein FtsZ